MNRIDSDNNPLVKNAKRFVDESLRPHAIEYDDAGIFPQKLINLCASQNFLSASFPIEVGGLGCDFYTGLLILRELSRGLGSIGLILCAHLFQSCQILLQSGNQQVIDQYLRDAIQGRKIISFALTEASGGSDAIGIDTTAVWDGAAWVLNGTKCWITNATVADAHIIVARTSLARGKNGISLFLVDKDTPGVFTQQIEGQFGMMLAPSGIITLKNCRVGPNALLGVENDGYHLVKSALVNGRLAISAVSIGIAQDAFDRSVEYSVQRAHYGRSISTYQGISFSIAEMYTNLRLSESLLESIVRRRDAGAPCSKDAAALKLFSSEMCGKACSDAMLIFGANGLKKSFEIDRLLRDSKMLTIGEGTSQICKIIISNSIFNNL